MDIETAQEATTAAPDTSGHSTESSGVSAAEPVAAEPVAAEPVAAEPTETASVEAAEASVEAAETVGTFPEVDSFDWDNWDGSDYEAFPDSVKPWADKLNGYHTKSLDSLTRTHNTEVDYWKRMYEAINYGDEDPRVAELTASLEEITNREKEAQERLETLTKEINQERDAENARYFKWFESNYQGKLEELAKSHGAEKAEQMVIDLMDLDMEVHVAVEVSLMGTEAVDTAKALAGQVKDTSLILEILNNRFKDKKAQVAAEETKAPEVPNPATQVVAGSAPVSRPVQLAKEKAPVYGSSNQRMASLMSAAENAIRKSKRR
tara:strand:- start:16993 stop:17955 length:963 start_codon:yes stop_codon:yes gene_type:complete